MRVVLDTNILVRANPQALPHSLARELLLTVLAEPHVLVLSAPILNETRRVFCYRHVQARWPMTNDVIDSYISLLEAAAFLVDLPAEVPAIVTDPDDDPILQTAILGAADVLCTRDVAFQREAVEQICGVHHIRVLDDIALRQELRKSVG